MQKLIMGIGIPGSGKTTFLKALAHAKNYIYISPDDIREKLLGDAADQSKDREVWVQAKRELTKRGADGKTVVFDATFSLKKDRKNFISFARTCGFKKIEGIFFNVPLAVAMKRNAGRARNVSQNVMERMHQNLLQSPPVLEEGFDVVRVKEFFSQ